MKKKKIIIITLVTFSVILIGGLGFAGNYFYNLALNPNTPKDIVFGTPDDQEQTSGDVLDEDIDWLLNEGPTSELNITSDDGLTLHAYEVLNENKTNKWVIATHGYTSDATQMSSYAKKFYDMGYNVLIPNLRGHGDSEGDYIGMGWHDRLDMLSWIELILKGTPDADIVLHGVSMGAATVMMTSGEDLPSNVKAIVADCGYTSVWDQFAYQLDELFSLPAFPIMHASSLVAKLRAGYYLDEASALEQVKKSKTPILFIHGDKDDFVPYEMMEELYNAAGSEKEMLTVEGAEHAKSSSANPELYWTTIYNFVNKYVK
ncbi:MAG TPA: alpha/beta hydrolase [Firmicutes bacterium]|nr:alpha/beta hydrolase [Bacillota bacterium]